MHHAPPELQIGKEGKGISSDFDPTLSTTVDISAIIETHRSRKLAGQSISNPHQSNSRPHLTVLIPPISAPSQQDSPNTSPFQPHHQDPNLSVSSHEPIFSNPSPSHSPLSKLHKRPLMNPPPSRLSYSRTLSSLRHYQQARLHTESSSSPSFSCCGLFVSLFPAKFFTLELLCPFRLSRLRRTHLQFLVVLSLPSFYFLVSNPQQSVLIDILSVVALLTALLISFNLALPRLPSIRLFLSRSLPVKLRSSFCATKPSQPTLWSIGWKPKLEKKATSGCLVQVYSNGDVYEGEFHKGKCSGSGVYYYHMSGKYEGDWVDGKYDGYGVETWARGSRYRGQYKQGLRHGIGVYRFHTGDVYSGEWSNGQSHGCGVHICEDGSRYVGEFKWGVKHGYGHYHFRNGDIYAGEYFADKMHGFGVYKFGNGHQYEGSWHEGRRQGLGVYTFRNGEMQSGHWQNGVLDIPSTLNKTLGASCAVNHTKVLNTVQEARQAAEKAYSVRKVDGRVNAAVSAANKAVNAARVAAVKAVQNRMRQDSAT